MTKTKTILAISLATAFVLSGVLIPAYAAGHLAIDKTEVKLKTDFTKTPIKQTFDVKIKASATIPLSGAFGYGIITDPDTFNNVLALTTHATVFDHTSQEDADDPVFHAHVLDLATGGTIPADSPSGFDPCGGFDAVVNFESTLDSGNNIDAQYKVKVKDKQIEVKKVPVSDLNDEVIEAIVSFKIMGMGVDPNAPDVSPEPAIPWLCLDIIGTGKGM